MGATSRDARIDVARGLAVIAMVAYHLVWDLAAFNLIDPATTATPAFRWSGALIASSFLFLSGMALTLARAAAPDAQAFQAKMLKRLAIIAGAAVLVSIGTWFAMGDRFVRFGILHCIALSGLIAWPLLRRPPWVAALMAGLFAVIPWVAASSAFDGVALIWTGLAATLPAMVDYVPIFPFAGALLAGVAFQRHREDAGPRASTDAGRLALVGRWSLPIYLVHQPLIYGGMLLALGGATPTPRIADVDRDTAGFRTECRRSCEAVHANDKALCDRYCACAETEMKATDAWTKVMASRDTANLQRDLAPLLMACMTRARDRP
jgi:uncharacterized membrane protein